MTSTKFTSESDEHIKLELKALTAKYDNKLVEAKWNDFENIVCSIMGSCILHKMTSSRFNLTVTKESD